VTSLIRCHRSGVPTPRPSHLWPGPCDQGPGHAAVVGPRLRAQGQPLLYWAIAWVGPGPGHRVVPGPHHGVTAPCGAPGPVQHTVMWGWGALCRIGDSTSIDSIERSFVIALPAQLQPTLLRVFTQPQQVIEPGGEYHRSQMLTRFGRKVSSLY